MSVCPQKKLIWFQWKRSMIDARWYAVWPDPRSRSWALQSWKSGHFQKLSPPPCTMGAGNWPLVLKLGIVSQFYWTWFLCQLAEASVVKSWPPVLCAANLFSLFFIDVTNLLWWCVDRKSVQKMHLVYISLTTCLSCLRRKKLQTSRFVVFLLHSK